jgi:hypothetical protein
MRSTLLPVLVLAVLASQADYLREAVTLGQTRDDALFESFNRGYELAASGVLDRAEIITEFRRAVLIERDQVRQGDYTFGPDDLAKAMGPLKGVVTFIVQVRLHPQNTYQKEPAYDLYISTGPRTPPIASKTLKREPVYAPGTGGPGTPPQAVKLEASFQRLAIERAASPFLVVTDDKAEILWQARVELSRYR